MLLYWAGFRLARLDPDQMSSEEIEAKMASEAYRDLGCSGAILASKTCIKMP
jgi:hypothetical protein